MSERTWSATFPALRRRDRKKVDFRISKLEALVRHTEFSTSRPGLAANYRRIFMDLRVAMGSTALSGWHWPQLNAIQFWTIKEVNDALEDAYEALVYEVLKHALCKLAHNPYPLKKY